MPISRKKIAVYLPGLYGGGAERAMLNLAQGLAARGHSVDLVLAQAVGPYLQDVPETIRIVDLKAKRTLTSLLPLARYLRRERPDAMVSALTRANIVAVLTRRLACVSTRVTVSERNMLSHSTKHSLKLSPGQPEPPVGNAHLEHVWSKSRCLEAVS